MIWTPKVSLGDSTELLEGFEAVLTVMVPNLGERSHSLGGEFTLIHLSAWCKIRSQPAAAWVLNGAGSVGEGVNEGLFHLS